MIQIIPKLIRVGVKAGHCLVLDGNMLSLVRFNDLFLLTIERDYISFACAGQHLLPGSYRHITGIKGGKWHLI